MCVSVSVLVLISRLSHTPHITISLTRTISEGTLTEREAVIMNIFLLSLFPALLMSPGVYTLSCNSDATYELELFDTWTSENHPNDFPGGAAHLSQLFGASHSPLYTMWAPGILATTGVQRVAEVGFNSPIKQEAEASGASLQTQNAPVNTLTLAVDANHSLLSAIYMIAPSPDWFSGVRDVDLCDHVSGQWIDMLEMTSQPYDSGTDCGTTYFSSNCVEDPKINVFEITPSSTSEGNDGPIFVKDNTVLPVASWRFYRVGSTPSPSAAPTTEHSCFEIISKTG